MHILFLSDNFPPEVNAPASRTFEHCRHWVKAGHKVTVVTGVPNFPTGRVFDGYRNQWRSTEVMDGIEVVRVWTYIAPNAGFFWRTLDYMSFMISAILATTGLRNVDIVVGTSPQLFTPCAAWIASRLKRCPYVFELRDLWPESIRAVGAMKTSRILDVLEGLELFLYERAAHIVCVTRAFRENLASRGVDPKKVSIVTNGADLSRFGSQPRDEELAVQLGLNDKFVVGYVGTHGMAHALGTVLRAAGRLRHERLAKDVRFLLLGDGAEKAGLQKEARRLGLDNLVFVDSVSRDQVARYWSLIDLSIIHLRRTPLFQTVIPSKMFECMAMGIPILHGVEGESLRMIERDGAGLAFEPENDEDLARSIAELIEDKPLQDRLSRNCLKAAKQYDRARLAAQMLEILHQIASDGKSAHMNVAADGKQ